MIKINNPSDADLEACTSSNQTNKIYPVMGDANGTSEVAPTIGRPINSSNLKGLDQQNHAKGQTDQNFRQDKPPTKSIGLNPIITVVVNNNRVKCLGKRNPIKTVCHHCKRFTITRTKAKIRSKMITWLIILSFIAPFF